MSKFSVKKPFTVLVAVVMLLVLGIVSFTKMTTDLLPSISLPYILVITTYPGASPEKVENDVTQVLESAFGTVNGVENVTSVSNENYSMITLEFAEDTNMDSAMVKLSSQIDQIELPDMAGIPSLLEISPDMMATMYAAVDYSGMDIYELTKFTEETVTPYLERQSGVASVTETGLVYHKDYHCSHLDLSIRMTHLELVEGLRNENGGKYYPCEHCVKGNGGNIYITNSGDRYHSSLSCSGLKRTIYAIPISEAAGKGACSRCGQ